MAAFTPEYEPTPRVLYNVELFLERYSIWLPFAHTQPQQETALGLSGR